MSASDEESGLPRLTGRCNCGAVSFVAIGPFRPAKACHCKSCRRQSGHYVAATETDFSKLATTGEAAIAWFNSTPSARRGFCPSCGAHLFWQRKNSARISIWMGCLDEPTGLRLADHIYVSEKGDYYDLTDSLPQRDRGST